MKAELEIFRVGTAPLCCLDKNSEHRENHLLILFAAKGMGSLLLLSLIVILSRPAQNTGDFIP